ncbi:hypothetical protein E4V51_27180 [Paenibacillus sp. 28ISP30-2]|nr:hypothetical protein [Paenibacillus sp. 28ISP30-2]
MCFFFFKQKKANEIPKRVWSLNVCSSDLPILSLFIKDIEILQLGIQYLTIMAFVFLISVIRDAYAQALGSIGKVKITLYVGLCAMAINITLDYGLIYGKLGLPNLGVAGAAWGTLIASGTSLLFLFVFIYCKSYYLNIRFQELFSLPLILRKQVVKTITPLVFHEGMWSIGNMLYAVAFGSLSIAALTTFQLANTLQGYFMSWDDHTSEPLSRFGIP